MTEHLPTSLRAYVATKWENRPRARQIMAALRAAGHEITYDWTIQEQESQTQAIADLEGVRAADVLILLVDEDLPYRGALVEFGAALAIGIPVLMIGDALHCLFNRHPLVTRITEAELSDMLAQVARRVLP